MNKFRIRGEIVAVNMSQEELSARVGRGSAFIKTSVGIGNNAAWACCQEALDHLRQHPNFRHRVKHGFMSAMEAFKAYERGLIYATENRLFHLDDLLPEYRKKYGDITDREYYEFWCGTGVDAYHKKHVWVMNLWNKFRLSLIAHKVNNAEIVAWGMTADATLKLATCIYENSIVTCVEDYNVPRQLLEAIFGGLKIVDIEKRWDNALALIEPFTATYDLTEQEQKNIQHGLDQLQEEWTSIATLKDSLLDAIDAYDDVFRTKGEMKKAKRHVAEMAE